MRWRRATAVALGVAALAGATATARAQATAAPSKFSLEVSPRVGGRDDTFIVTVQIEVEGVSGPERYWEPPFPDFELLDKRSSQAPSVIVDPDVGRRLRTLEVHRYFIKPKRLGRHRIGPAKVRVGDRDYETTYGWILVDDGARAGSGHAGVPDALAPGGVATVPGFESPPPDRAANEMFLYAVASDRRVYEGQQVTVSWLLYTRAEVLGFEPSAPELGDFWSESVFEPDKRLTYHETSIAGTPYYAVIVSQRALFPTRPGRSVVGRYTARVRSMNAADGKAERLASNQLRVYARSLPRGAPAGFDRGYVGAYSVDTAVDRDRIEAGGSFTLTVTVRGEGAIRRTRPPAIEVEGFDIAEPRDWEESTEVANGVVRGERVYRYWVTPRVGGKRELPPVEIPYFDPRAGAYAVARSRPIAIEVVGDPAALEVQAAPRNLKENVIARDIRLLARVSSVSSRLAPGLYRTWWLWLLLGLPPLVYIAVVVIDTIREHARKETPRARLRRARGLVNQHMRVAEIHLRGQRPPQFFGELSKMLYAHLQERLGQPVAALTREEQRALLQANGFSSVAIERIHRELDSCDFARFAPTAAGPGEMRAALRRVRELIGEIERVRVQEPGTPAGSPSAA